MSCPTTCLASDFAEAAAATCGSATLTVTNSTEDRWVAMVRVARQPGGTCSNVDAEPWVPLILGAPDPPSHTYAIGTFLQEGAPAQPWPTPGYPFDPTLRVAFVQVTTVHLNAESPLTQVELTLFANDNPNLWAKLDGQVDWGTLATSTFYLNLCLPGSSTETVLTTSGAAAFREYGAEVVPGAYATAGEPATLTLDISNISATVPVSTVSRAQYLQEETVGHRVAILVLCIVVVLGGAALVVGFVHHKQMLDYLDPARQHAAYQAALHHHRLSHLHTAAGLHPAKHAVSHDHGMHVGTVI